VIGAILVRIFDVIKASADDAKLNAAIKKSKDFRSLGANLVMWALPMVLAYGMSLLTAKISPPSDPAKV